MTSQPAKERSADGGRLATVVVAVLVVAVAAAAIISSRRPAAELDPQTPQGALQAFFRAIEADDWDGARGLLSNSLQSECDAAELASSNYEFSQVVLEDQSSAGEQTFISVSVVRVDGTDPLSPTRFEDRLDFTLIEEGGSAKISILPWPFFCER